MLSFKLNMHFNIMLIQKEKNDTIVFGNYTYLL